MTFHLYTLHWNPRAGVFDPLHYDSYATLAAARNAITRDHIKYYLLTKEDTLDHKPPEAPK